MTQFCSVSTAFVFLTFVFWVLFLKMLKKCPCCLWDLTWLCNKSVTPLYSTYKNDNFRKEALNMWNLSELLPNTRVVKHLVQDTVLLWCSLGILCQTLQIVFKYFLVPRRKLFRYKYSWRKKRDIYWLR